LQPCGRGDRLVDVPRRHDRGPTILRGAIQKGPFVLGSSVTLAAIDSNGASTGQIFSTQTTTDLGDFGVTFAYRGYMEGARRPFD